MWGVLHERPTARHGRGREDEERRDGGDGHNSKKTSRASRASAMLRTLDISFEPWLKENKRSERAATPLGAPQILSTGGLPNVYLRRSKQNVRKNHGRFGERQLHRRGLKRSRKASTESIERSAREIKTTPLTLKGTGGKFLFRGSLTNNLLRIVF